MRKTALKILTKTEEQDSYLNLVFTEELRGTTLSSADISFLKELIFGIFRNKILLDYIIRKNSSLRLKKIDPKILNILRMGAYQILFMDKVPDFAAVSESVTLAKKCASPKTVSFVNGVLRGITKNRMPDFSEIKDYTERLSVQYSYPLPLADFFVKTFGKRAESLMASGNIAPDLCIRVNTLKITKDELKKKLDELNITYTDTPYADSGLYLFGATEEKRKKLSGLFTVQDQSSQLAALSLSPQAGDVVYDLCSAPGGKTTHIAELMENKGEILATDIYPARLKSVDELAKNLGISIIKTKVCDAQTLDETLVGTADKVLADVPCSGLGIIRRKPDIKYKEDITDFKELTQIQKNILSVGCSYLKPGGVIVYSTCTVNPQENINLICEFLKTHPEMSLEKIESEHILEALKENEGFFEIYPDTHQSDGFFVCRLRRKQ